MALSKRAQKVLETAQKLAQDPDSEWTAIGHNTIRWSRTMPTPDFAREERPVASNASRPLWPGDTFTQSVFLTFFGFYGDKRVKPKVLKRVDRAPWMYAQDIGISQREALEVLETPEAEFATVDGSHPDS